MGFEVSGDEIPIDCDGAEHDEEGVRRIKACYPYENNITTTDINRKYDPRARIEIDLEELFGGITKQPLRVPLIPGDAILLPPPALVQVFGEVERRGSFQVSGGGENAGRSSVSIKPSLLSAIVASGGLTFSANIHEVEIYRELEFGNKVILTVDLEESILRGGQDVRLRDGDIIWVPGQTNRFYEEHTIRALNSLAGTTINVDRAADVGS